MELSDRMKEILKSGQDLTVWVASWIVEVAELEEGLSDWRKASKKVLDETCSSDEKHCACVPFLRMEIKRLRDENATLKKKVRDLRVALLGCLIHKNSQARE